MPFEARLALLFVFGVAWGGLLNLAIYRLAIIAPRQISPWSRPPQGARPRTLADRIPVFGWLGLRRESSLHGRGFWLRPMLLEIGVGAGLAALYWWEVGQAGLTPHGTWIVPPGEGVRHLQFLSHTLLLSLMVVASFIDLDEKLIPDTITIPGTLLGLALATLAPQSLLPHWTEVTDVPWRSLDFDFLKFTSPLEWPASMDGAPEPRSLALGLGCLWLWCFILLPRPWRTRRGYRRALQILLARVKRERFSLLVLLMGLACSAAIMAVWLVGGAAWQGLLTALVGLIGSAGLVWTVRIVASAALGREAMGLGDVTLMAMAGAFLGWQACLMVFFLAPVAGSLIGLASLLLKGEHEIRYGPFLCLASVVVIVYWEKLWSWAMPAFNIGWLAPAVLAVGMALTFLLLAIWRGILSLFVREG